MFENPLTVDGSGTPVAGRISRLGCCAALLPTSPPTTKDRSGFNIPTYFGNFEECRAAV